MEHDLTVQDVAREANCHPNTVRRYEQRGLIEAMRDINGYRRFSRDQVERLKELLEMRVTTEQGEN
ncbi:MerR family transcriptional regulator [Desulfoferula mesophila]|uniref:HTH merR-type domain-containing protein n=1 Tax=Desulfoferula mesophila TaxID=3058419 RepID=A0AAU9E881_9BACT|nr:hypothetical protein FAK_01910 [Desulfoferula mesophilus]